MILNVCHICWPFVLLEGGHKISNAILSSTVLLNFAIARSTPIPLLRFNRTRNSTALALVFHPLFS